MFYRKNTIKKLLFVSLLLPILLLVSCSDSDSGGASEPVNNKTAFDYFMENDIRAGINIGNSMDAHRNGVSGETLWVQTKVNQDLLNGIKKAGFDIVRIPVTWMGHIGDAPDYKVEEAWLERVVEIAGYAETAGFKAVIVNLHHDGSTTSTTVESGWLSINKSLADPANKNEITAKFSKLWEQIANRFKDHGEWLIFEAFNELHDGRWFWAGRVNQVPDEQYALINEWTQVFTNTVRATGGNNSGRYLVIPSYCTGPEALLTDNFVLPVDSAKNKQIAAFHYYRPDAFALDGTDTAWSNDAAREDIINNFSKISQKFIDNNIPVIIGETGPVRFRTTQSTTPQQQAQAVENRLAYIAFMFGMAKNNFLIPVYWDNGSSYNFGVFDRITGEPANAEQASVIQAMVDAVKD